MKSCNRFKVIIATVVLALTSSPSYAEKGGNGGDKGGGGNDGGNGNLNAIVYLDNDSPYIPYVVSQSFSNQGQAVFYGRMDLSEFPGEYNNGVSCTNGLTDGIIVINRQTKISPQAVELIFWYNDVLESGESITHLLTMTGKLDEPGNWPPVAQDPQTTLTLEYWEFAAENRKAQRQDCAGSYDFKGDGPWTVSVSLVE